MKERIKIFLQQNWYRILAIILLLWALSDNPYGYYQFLRWVILVIGVYSAYSAYSTGKKSWAWIFSAIAVLFNPIVPFYLQKDTWQFIDIITATVFSVSLFREHKKD